MKHHFPPERRTNEMPDQFGTVDELIADSCSIEVMRAYLKLTAPPRTLMDSARMRIYQLEMSMLKGAGPGEICAQIDLLEKVLEELRGLYLKP